jgi:hypothetical protein
MMIFFSHVRLALDNVSSFKKFIFQDPLRRKRTNSFKKSRHESVSFKLGRLSFHVQQVV